MKVVLDTNTVVSALFWKGSPREVLDLAYQGSISLFTCPALLAELTDVLEREKFSLRLEQANVSASDLIQGFAALAMIIQPGSISPVILADPDDDQVLACAVSSEADVIISGDHHLLDLEVYEDIKILTANEFLTQV